MQTELYKRYRPRTLADVVGQDSAVRSLNSMVERSAVAHTLLITGPSGCGKTTIGRVMRRLLNCGKQDYLEINAADFKGVDTIRDIRRGVGLRPIAGDVRIWMIDECFPKGTLISTPTGKQPIETLQSGNVVFGLSGASRINKVFQNKVELERVVKVSFSDGNHLFTTLQHRVFTTKGWKEAGELKKGDCFFSNLCYPMRHDTNMRVLQERVPTSLQRPSGLLLKKLRGPKEKQRKRIWTNKVARMPRMQEIFFRDALPSKSVLLPELCKETHTENQFGIQTKTLQSKGSEKDINSGEGFLPISRRKRASSTILPKDVFGQPFTVWLYNPKSSTHQKGTGLTTYMERDAWREWAKDERTNPASQCTRKGMGDGTFDNYGTLSTRQEWFSGLLQSGHSLSSNPISNRSRWENAPLEKAYLSGCEEDPKTKVSWVESVEIYQPGYNDQTFNGVVGDKDREQGFVTFYDFEVIGHPSYFANGIPVHNCHQLTKDAQSALLKLLEDTPDHAYFFLATTDPQKVLKTIHTRSTEIKLKPLGVSDLKAVISRVIELEKMQVSADVVEEVISASDGSARKALVLLEQVGFLPADEQVKAIQTTSFQKEAAIVLARLLFNPRCSWSEVAKVLKDLTEEPETIRYMVLGYARAILLGGGPLATRAFMVIDVFARNFYDSKQAGLAAACWEVVNAPRQ